MEAIVGGPTDSRRMGGVDKPIAPIVKLWSFHRAYIHFGTPWHREMERTKTTA